MSEYQCYEFLALERPLTSREMAELRAISTRAEITPTRFWNEYQWGDLKADPAKLVERYFDVHMYFANWGSHRLMLRIPTKVIDARALRAYFVGDAARVKVAGEHLILDLLSNDEECHDEGVSQGSLGSLVALRGELMSGDFRPAYIAWLLAVQGGDISDEDAEPPVPPGLSALTAAQTSLVEFLHIDEDLLAAAAAASVAETDDAEAVRAWVFALSERAKGQWLVRAIEDPGLALGAELLRAFRGEGKTRPRPGRRVAELRVAAEQLRETREQAERLAREKAKKVAAAAKNKRLDRLAIRVDSAWTELEAMIERKDYEGAVKLALDLRDLATRDDAATQFASAFQELRARQRGRRGFFDRWRARERAGSLAKP